MHAKAFKNRGAFQEHLPFKWRYRHGDNANHSSPVPIAASPLGFSIRVFSSSTNKSMPRLPRGRIVSPFSTSHALKLLLRECRDLNSARNELRWLREHAQSLNHGKRNYFTGKELRWLREHAQCLTQEEKDYCDVPEWHETLKKMVEQRARGRPLQYILGTQPFGDLEILCRPGVLIPR